MNAAWNPDGWTAEMTADGTHYRQRFECDPPPFDRPFLVLKDAWNDTIDPPERVIYEVEVL